jgi:hypothetical protein
MLTRNVGRYTEGFYYISPEASIQSEASSANSQALSQDIEAFIEDINYEIASHLKFTSNQRTSCKFRISINENVSNYLQNTFHLTKSRFRDASNFIEEHNIITERFASDRNLIKIQLSSFRMKLLERKPIEYRPGSFLTSRSKFVCIEFLRDKVILPNNQ